MQVRIISIPVVDGDDSNESLNKFLRSVKVLEMEQKLVQLGQAAYWSFCIRYIESSSQLNREKRDRLDYKEILSAEDFTNFSKLRVIRKSIAEEDGVPAFAIFTDEELSGLARLAELSQSTMRSVKGVGDKKVEKYAERFLKALNDEKSK